MTAEDLALQFLLLPASRKIYDRVAMCRPVPDVYHYTTEAGLAGILESRAIWATEARHLNDTTELTYAARLIREALTAEISRIGSDYRPWLTESTKVVDRVIAETQIFVASFCSEGDLLSQWRGYAKAGSCIRLSGAALAQLPNCHIVRVEYDPAVQRQTIIETLAVHLLALEKARDIGRQEPINHVSGNFGAQLSLYASCFKHPSFSEEREWRAITSNAVLPSRYRQAYGTNVPYVEIPLAPQGHTLPIVDIIQSPLSTNTKGLEETRRIAASFGYAASTVRESGIPIRGGASA